MVADTKLPRSLQLVGLTSVLVFAISAVSTYAYVKAIAAQWHLFGPIPKTWENFYYPIFSLPTLYGLLAVASGTTFLVLWLAPRASLVKASLIYLALLFVALVWRIYIHIPSSDWFGFRAASIATKIYLGVHFFYAFCIIGLAYGVLPNYSLKRTAAGRLRYYHASAAAAA
jgi:hypothetical protein